MADKDAVPTVIYDEIDSGVSGKAALSLVFRRLRLVG